MTPDQTIALACLRESPTNPRRAYSDASLSELADSIRSQGVLQPIVVREIAQADIEHTHEIVFGHCRYRAALRAGLDRIPAIVRQMTDAEAAIAQIHENLHRKDVHALEEADAFRALLQQHGMTVEQIVADSGKSRSYVYGRLKLANLSPAVRAACLDDGLGAEIALLLARLPAHKVQDDALQSLRQGGDWTSYRQAKVHIARYLVDLSAATFDLADDSFQPAGACAQCVKMACNDPDLHELAPTICTDRGCFDIKNTAHAARVITLARESGRDVIEGAQAAQMCYPYLHDVLNTAERLTDTAFERNGRLITWADALQDLPSDQRDTLRPALLVHPQNPLRPLDVLTPDQQDRVLRALGILDPSLGSADPAPSAAASAPAATSTQGGEGEDKGTADPGWTDEERAVLGAGAWTRILRAIFARLVATPRTADELRLIVMDQVETLGGLGIGGDELGVDDILTLGADQLGALAVMLAIESKYGTQSIPARGIQRARQRVDLAKLYGIDPLALAGQPNQIDEAGLPAGGAPRSTATTDLFGDATEADDEQDDEPAAPAASPRPKRPDVKYRCPLTGQTWSGRGLKPKWLTVALEGGRALGEFEV